MNKSVVIVVSHTLLLLEFILNRNILILIFRICELRGVRLRTRFFWNQSISSQLYLACGLVIRFSSLLSQLDKNTYSNKHLVLQTSHLSAYNQSDITVLVSCYQHNTGIHHTVNLHRETCSWLLGAPLIIWFSNELAFVSKSARISYEQCLYPCHQVYLTA